MNAQALLAAAAVGITIAIGSRTPETTELETSISGAMPTTPSPKTAGPLRRAYHYYNRDRKRTVWLNEHLVAEIMPNATGKKQLQSFFPGSRAIKTHSIQRVWRTPTPNEAHILATMNAPLEPGAAGTTPRFSPVFHTGPSDANSARALGGGVIVLLQSNWSEADVASWAHRASVRIEKRLVEGVNMFLIATPPGLPALKTANRLHESKKGVVWANPDWAVVKR